MPLTLKPATGSGQMTLISVAGTTTSDTLTLPAKTGNIITSADTGTVTQAMLGTNIATTGPAFSAYATANQSVTSSVYTKVTFDTEEFDTNNNFASSRFTPTVAGYYNVTGIVYGTGTTATTTYCNLYKNGAGYQLGSFFANYNSVNGASIVTVTVYMNGTTDYLEIYAVEIASSGAQFTVVAGGVQSRFSGFLARTA